MKLLSSMLDFIANTSGLRAEVLNQQELRIRQVIDGKTLILSTNQLEDVLYRSDSSGAEFIQINFIGGMKLLLTDKLVGFKPRKPKGVDLTRVPRVVTTPDIINVFEAIQDSLHSLEPDPLEVSVLKKIFESVVAGGEDVGFNLSVERSWLSRIPATCGRFSA